eukprot:Gregarina_sp_Poly_1__3031@NODE_1850_length_3211_cov_192_031170_g1171_i1_p2_GENE_NODE_1850_length_3211_cov_192_031170_g1171_i1NODE_1850_length_3211_cov_192_031170_g1171_i1_p2_ORF_typecomplete_len280_score54_01DEK_C/PF08766_11/0_065HMGCoA_red/PF00368_18/3_9e03HMGCoA_red/PF00368_18/0_064TERB2/PF15101_6/0_56TERB2/PF15101_6/1_5e03Coilin_N/PF15862_5/0_25Coilin_N/PF15862_5/6_5e03_NODE_1850_length_3211_cov_192_031170_g1171_i114922331
MEGAGQVDSVRERLLNHQLIEEQLKLIVTEESDLTVFSANVIFQRLSERLGIDIPAFVQSDPQVKKFIKTLAREVVEEEAAGRDIDEEPETASQEIKASDKEPTEEPKRGRKRKAVSKETKHAKKKIKTRRKIDSVQKRSSEVDKKSETEKQHMGKLIRILKFPPSIYKELDKENSQEYAKELKSRLIQMCMDKKVIFTKTTYTYHQVVHMPRLPTASEAQQWIRRKEFQDELNEIAVSTLAEGTKRRRTVRSTVKNNSRKTLIRRRNRGPLNISGSTK